MWPFKVMHWLPQKIRKCGKIRKIPIPVYHNVQFETPKIIQIWYSKLQRQEKILFQKLTWGMVRLKDLGIKVRREKCYQ